MDLTNPSGDLVEEQQMKPRQFTADDHFSYLVVPVHRCLSESISEAVPFQFATIKNVDLTERAVSVELDKSRMFGTYPRLPSSNCEENCGPKVPAIIKKIPIPVMKVGVLLESVQLGFTAREGLVLVFKLAAKPSITPTQQHQQRTADGEFAVRSWQGSGQLSTTSTESLQHTVEPATGTVNPSKAAPSPSASLPLPPSLPPQQLAPLAMSPEAVAALSAAVSAAIASSNKKTTDAVSLSAGIQAAAAAAIAAANQLQSASSKKNTKAKASKKPSSCGADQQHQEPSNSKEAGEKNTGNENAVREKHQALNKPPSEAAPADVEESAVAGQNRAGENEEQEVHEGVSKAAEFRIEDQEDQEPPSAKETTEKTGGKKKKVRNIGPPETAEGENPHNKRLCSDAHALPSARTPTSEEKKEALEFASAVLQVSLEQVSFDEYYTAITATKTSDEYKTFVEKLADLRGTQYLPAYNFLESHVITLCHNVTSLVSTSIGRKRVAPKRSLLT